MKKLIGYAISLAVLLFGAIGNFHLYKEAGEWSASIRNIVITVTTIGVELAVLLLIHAIADRKLTGTMHRITCGLMLAFMPLSLMGQYAYLLKEASVKTAKTQIAIGNVSEIAEQRATLENEKKNLFALLQSEAKAKESAQADFDAEKLNGGIGKKALAIQATVDSIGMRMEKLQTQIDGTNHRLDSLIEKKENAQVASVEVTELSNLAQEFGFEQSRFLKIMVFVFLTAANLIGFWLVYIANVSDAVKAAHKARKAERTVRRKKKTKRVRPIKTTGTEFSQLQPSH